VETPGQSLNRQVNAAAGTPTETAEKK
jgi:hypothetical protein